MNLRIDSSLALRAALLAASICLSAPALAGTLRFNFTQQPMPGATQVKWSERSGAPLYDAATGYGFVERTGALPARPVHVRDIRSEAHGFVISEQAFEQEKGFEKDHYNNFGMAFRVKAEPGAYAIRVKTTSAPDDTIVSVTGMQTSRLSPGVFWDAAGLLPNRTTVSAEGRE